MDQHTRKSKFLILLFIFVATFSLFAKNPSPKNPGKTPDGKPIINNFGYGIFVDFHIIFGFGYIFNLTTAKSHFTMPFSLNTPVGVAVDVRFIEWFSLFSGIEFLYELQSFTYKREISGDRTEYIQSFYNNLQIDLPFIVKFYPFVYKSDNYDKMFFAAGLVAHFSPARFYKVIKDVRDEDGDIESTQIEYGDALRDSNGDLFPSDCYVPANIGVRLSMGNTFMFQGKAGLGLELFVEHLFIPTINGYFSNPQYKINDNPFLDFNLTIGLTVSIAIRAFSKEP